MKSLVATISLLFLLSCSGQSQELQYRNIESYFEQIAKLEMDSLIERGILVDSMTIAEKYLDKETKWLTSDGMLKYMDVKMNIYTSFFKDYLYQQHLVYGDQVFVLYFTVAGYDDIEWSIVKWDRKDWKNEEKLSPSRLGKDSTITKIFWNYDEGPKNIEHIRLFIENDYLVFERGNLYHSLYDLKTNLLLFNEESPWHASNGASKKELNEWIKFNLHDQIDKKLKAKNRSN